MGNYSQEEYSEALHVVASSISSCIKIQPKFAEGTSQHSLLKNRIKALSISKLLIENNDERSRFSKEELIDALRPISSIINKCEKAQSKYEEGSSNFARYTNLLNAMKLSKSLIMEEISTKDRT